MPFRSMIRFMSFTIKFSKPIVKNITKKITKINNELSQIPTFNNWPMK